MSTKLTIITRALILVPIFLIRLGHMTLAPSLLRLVVALTTSRAESYLRSHTSTAHSSTYHLLPLASLYIHVHVHVGASLP